MELHAYQSKAALGRSDGSQDGRRPTGRTADDWAAEAASRGAGEVFINAIDHDGMGKGYDLDLIRSVTSRLSIPVIACGGAGKFADLAAAICDAGAVAVATADIFCFKKLSHLYAKQAVREAGVSVRPSAVLDMARRKPPRAL